MKSRLGIVLPYLVFTVLSIVISYHLSVKNSIIPDSLLLIYLIFRMVIGNLSVLVVIGLIQVYIHHRKIFPLTLSGILFVIGYYLETLSLLLLNTTDQVHILLSKYIFMISQFLFTISPVILMYFIVAYFKPEPTFWEFSPIILETMLEVVFIPLEINLGTSINMLDGLEIKNWEYLPDKTWINIVYFLSVFWLVAYIGYLVLQSKKEVIDETLKRQQLLIVSGISIVFILTPLVYLINLIISDPVIRFLWVNAFYRVFIVLGLFMFLYEFIQSTEKLDFFRPQPLDSLYIIDLNSKELLTKWNFRREANEQLAGLILDHYDNLNDMLSEVIGEDVRIRSIDIHTHEVLIRNTGDLMVILLVKYQTAVIRERLAYLLSKLSTIGDRDLKQVLGNSIETVFGA